MPKKSKTNQVKTKNLTKSSSLFRKILQFFWKTRFIYYWVFLGAAFLALAIWYTRPLISNFSTQIIGQNDFTDGPFFLWNLWWVKKALLSFQNPFFSTFVYYPAYANLTLHTLTFTSGLLALPVSWFLGLVRTLNLILLLSFTATALGMVYLVYDMTKNRFAGIIAGLAFSFSPYVFGHLWAGHYVLTMLWPIPFLILFFQRTLRENRIINPILCSVFFLLLVYLDLQLTMSVIMIVLVLFVSALISNRKSFNLEKILHLGIIVLSFLLLFAVPYLYWTSEFPKIAMGTFNNGDLAMIFGFNPLNPYLSPEGKLQFVKNLVGSYRENTMSLSFAALFAATGSFVFFNRKMKTKITYVVIAFIGIVLSLGPNWQNFGIYYDNIRLPYYYIAKLPFFDMGIVPTRFIVIAYFGVAILAGLFCADLLQTAKTKWAKSFAVFVLVILSFIVGFEDYSGKMLMTPITTSPILDQIRRDPADVNVISYRPDALDGWWQTIHQKKVVGGYLGRRVHDYYMEQYIDESGIAYLLGLRYNSVDELDKNKDEVLKNFKKYNIGYIVVQKQRFDKDEIGSLKSYLENNISLKIWQEDSFVLAYKIQ